MKIAPLRERQTPAELSALRILVVDDHPSTLRLVCDVLRASGVGQVFTARDGLEGLRALARHDPHLVFCDWNMPRMDGEAFARTIRRTAVAPDPRVPDPRVPIVMLTGKREQRDVEVARRAGVDEFVVKPFTPAALLTRIDTALNRRRPFVISEVFIGPDRRRRGAPGYDGPLRRTDDPEQVADDVERELARETISVELEAMRRLIAVRGGADRETLRMTYRMIQQTEHRARRTRDASVERAAQSLTRYVERIGGVDRADPEVVEVHMDAIRSLIALPDDEAEAAGLVIRRLEQAVERKLARARAA
ncbi:MAG: response regulator [Caulobacter sp.]|nr:response regulator [Caulobacter sp.]